LYHEPSATFHCTPRPCIVLECDNIHDDLCCFAFVSQTTVL
jgi:hypothetical protein